MSPDLEYILWGIRSQGMHILNMTKYDQFVFPDGWSKTMQNESSGCIISLATFNDVKLFIFLYSDGCEVGILTYF